MRKPWHTPWPAILVLGFFCALAAEAGAFGPLTVLYSADERGEIEPCG